jgi:hypothetical protein
VNPLKLVSTGVLKIVEFLKKPKIKSIEKRK